MASLQSSLLRYKNMCPYGTKWTQYKVNLGQQGEDWTKKRLGRINGGSVKFKLKNHIPWGNGDIDHLVEYQNGVKIMLDSKNWKCNHDTYINQELSSKLQSEVDYLRNQKGIKIDAVGVVFYNLYIPKGIQKTDFGFYKVHPDYLGKFIKEMGVKK